eukprot:1898229-Amphidinium_carterae.1
MPFWDNQPKRNQSSGTINSDTGPSNHPQTPNTHWVENESKMCFPNLSRMSLKLDPGLAHIEYPPPETIAVSSFLI